MKKFNCITIETAVANLSVVMETDTILKNGRELKSQTSRKNLIQRISLLFAIFCISMINICAQDVITMKNGDNIDAIVQEIGTDEVKYKRFDNPNGPTYTLKKSGIVMIKYSNGSSDVFTDNTARSVTEYESMPFITDDFNPEINTRRSVAYGIPLPTSKSTKQKYELLREFEIKMDSLGFKKRIVSYDFLSEESKKSHHEYGMVIDHSVGLWVNYQKQLIALRLDKDDWNEIIIPFDKIQKVEIIEDGFVKTKGSAVGYGNVAIGRSRSESKSTGLQVRIVTGDIKSGTKTYFVKILDIEWGSVSQSHPSHKARQECAKTISDELEIIMNYEW